MAAPSSSSWATERSFRELSSWRMSRRISPNPGLDVKLTPPSPSSKNGFQQYKFVEMKLLAPQRDLQALVADFEASEGIYSCDCIEDTDQCACDWEQM